MRKSVKNRVIALIIAVLTVMMCACSSPEEVPEEVETVETVEEEKTLDEIAILFTGKMLGANKSESDFKKIKERAEELKKQNIKVDIVDCGSFIGKETTGSADVAASTLRAMASAGYSHAVIDRSEFDFGMDGLRGLVGMDAPKLMSCNFRYSGFQDDITESIPRYDVVEIGNVKIGYVAVSDPDALETHKDAFVEDARVAYSFCSRSTSYLCETVQTYINACKAGDADYVIVLSGISSSEKVGIADLTMMTSDVDAFICAKDSGQSETLESFSGTDSKVKIGCLRGGADTFGELRISPDGNITFSFQ